MHGVVAMAFPAATEAGLEMLRAGGNAVDAAVAAAWALAVCEPSGSGLGGSTLMLIHLPAGRTVVVGGQSCAPAAVSRKTVSRRQQQKGYRACTTPTTAATLGCAQARYGLLPLGRVMEPAVRLAEEGYPVTRLQRRQQKQCLADLSAQPAARRLFLKGGRPFRAGDCFRQPELANTLKRLARAGVEDFHRGRIARDIADDMAENGGLLTREDLAGAAAPIRASDPITIRYRGREIASAPQPAGGAQLLLAMKVLEQFSPGELSGQADDWYAIVAEVIYAVFRNRDLFAAPPGRLTPAFYDWLLGDEHAARIACAVRTPAGVPALRRAPEGPGETTHLSAADAQGCIVALTQSIQSVYGAKVAHGKLGFLYNNYLCTSPRGRHPYQLAGRCIPRSNAAPTLVFGKKRCQEPFFGKPETPMIDSRKKVPDTFFSPRPLLALGAAGSRRITSSILQVLSCRLDRGLTLAEAVAHPRIHATLGRTVHVEKPAASAPLLARLEKRFRAVEVRGARSFYMGAVQAVWIGEDGTLAGAADPRRDGTAGAT